MTINSVQDVLLSVVYDMSFLPSRFSRECIYLFLIWNIVVRSRTRRISLFREKTQSPILNSYQLGLSFMHIYKRRAEASKSNSFVTKYSNTYKVDHAVAAC